MDLKKSLLLFCLAISTCDRAMHVDRDLGQKLRENAITGNIERVKQLIAEGAPVNQADKTGLTPLHFACFGDHEAVAQELLSSGACVNQTNENNITPLHAAAGKGHVRAILKLLEWKADITKVDNAGSTPLHIAAAHGHAEVVQKLLEHIKTNQSNFITVDCVNQTTNSYTPLYLASCNGNIETVQALLSHGACVDQTDNDGNSPLHNAAQLGHTHTAQELLVRGSCVDRANKNGTTSLHTACWEGHEATVQKLLEWGADKNKTDIEGNTPLHLAALRGHIKVTRALLAGPKKDVEQGIESHDDKNYVNQKNIHDMTPLHLAANHGHVELVRELLTYGAWVEQLTDVGLTPLHLACFQGHETVIKELIKQGAHINRANSGSTTPLHMAIMKDQIKTAQILISEGALVDQADIDGNTSLHLAAKYGNIQAIKLLVEKGACINQVNKNGDTPLSFAIRYGYVKIIQELQKHMSFECPYCFTQTPFKDGIRLGCEHICCKECLIEALKTAIQSFTAANLHCPLLNCGGTLQKLGYKFTSQDIDGITRGLDNAQELRAQFQKITAMDFVRTLGSIGRQCPTANCANVWTFEHVDSSPDAQSFKCFCGNSYCRNCLIPWYNHIKNARILSCRQAHEYHEQLCRETTEGRAERQAREYAMQEGAFYCPQEGCNNLIIRDAGCDHMICGKDTHNQQFMPQGCRYDFCIKCLLPWIGHGENYFGGGCPGALQHHVAQNNPWALELQRVCSQDPSQGCQHWKNLCQKHGPEKAKALIYHPEK